MVAARRDSTLLSGLDPSWHNSVPRVLVQSCSSCRDVGWVIDAEDIARGRALSLKLTPCVMPGCEHSGREVVSLAVNEMQLTRTSTVQGTVASVSI